MFTKSSVKWLKFSLYFSAVEAIRCCKVATEVDLSVSVAISSCSGLRLTCALFAGITVAATKAWKSFTTRAEFMETQLITFLAWHSKSYVLLRHRIGATEPSHISLPLASFETVDFTVDVLCMCVSAQGKTRVHSLWGRKSARVKSDHRNELWAKLQHCSFVSSPLSHRDSITFGTLHFKAFFTPGHTVGHMIYLLDGKPIGSPSSLFSGDLVFLAGCGKSGMNEVQGKLLEYYLWSFIAQV